MKWIKAESSDFAAGAPASPSPRSGHTAVNVNVPGKPSNVVFFGGFADRRFLNDVTVYDTENRLWFSPECTGSGSDEQVGPAARAFHVAVAIDCHMFVYGGRSGNKRLNDFWMLDTDIWQWSELTGFGDLPSPREFAAASSIGNRKIVMYGGWDGKRWLSDVYILDTMSLEWTELAIIGSSPSPRCGHTATMIEKRLLIFGGRGGGGPIMGDLWALKGLIGEENETPGWTQLKLPGQPPSPRCGHTLTSGGHNLLLFGGHGTGGWLSRYDIYYNDCIILDRVSVQWKRLHTTNDAPPPRAYHSLTCIGSRYLLFGGFDGKSTFGDLWWLVSEDDPIAKRFSSTAQDILSHAKTLKTSGSTQAILKESEMEESPIMQLQKIYGIHIDSSAAQRNLLDEADESELTELSSKLAGDTLSTRDPSECLRALRDHWKNTSARSITLKELGPLLRDYQYLVSDQYLQATILRPPFTLLYPYGKRPYRFFHLRSASQLRLTDLPELLDEYKQLISQSFPKKK